MYSAYNKESVGLKGKQLLFCVVSNSFRIKSKKLRDIIFNEATSISESESYPNLHKFFDHAKYVWETIKVHADLTDFENVKAIRDKDYLTQIVYTIERQYLNHK